MNCKIYLSDEGFGHLVRQRAIHEQLSLLNPKLKATVQTGSYAEVARDMFSSAELIKKFNNIHWAKQKNGSPDLDMIKDFFKDYETRSDDFISSELNNIEPFDFLISDFVYEAFPIAKKANIPSFGVAHFTWDWFFSKMYPIPVSYRILEKMQAYAQMAETVYFPPFTPEEILKFFGKRAKQVPLIVRDIQSKPQIDNNGKFTVLIMDSGASVLREHIDQAIEQLGSINSIHFLIAEKYGIIADNVSTIPKDRFFSDYIPEVDLVITRGGFNTISECIAHRTPVLLLGETSNPEIEKNLFTVKQEQLGSFISLDSFVHSLDSSLSSFIDNEYNQIKSQMESHEYTTDGAAVIAEDILNSL